MDSAITGMSIISPFGVGTRLFLEGVRARTGDPGQWDWAGRIPEGAIEWEDVSGRVPRRMAARVRDRPSEMVGATLEYLFQQHDVSEYAPEDRALVLATGFTGVDQTVGILRESLTEPDNITVQRVPTGLMNYASAQCAIRFDLRGANVTVSNGRVGGLLALKYAERLLRSGRARMVVAGAFEELNERRAGVAAARGEGPFEDILSEGCCLFLVETRSRAAESGRVELLECHALTFGVYGRAEEIPMVLNTAVREALRRSSFSPADVGLVVATEERRQGFLDEALKGLFPETSIVAQNRIIGEAYGADSALQIATAIALSESSPPVAAGGFRAILVVAVDPDGHIGCALFGIPVGSGNEWT